MLGTPIAAEAGIGRGRPQAQRGVTQGGPGPGQAGGSAIGGFQLVQGLIADSVTEYRAGRALVLDTARAYDAGTDQIAGPSAAKYFCSEMVGRVADRAVQIHGGAGYMRGVAVERFYRDARLFRIYEGTSQIQQVIIARETMKRGG
jgi:acyl-CoA dehydrogenase